MAARRAAVADPPAYDAGGQLQPGLTPARNDTGQPEYVAVQPTALHPGALFQVLDTNGTWHAASVGAGVLCDSNRRAARSNNVTEGFDPTTTVEWDYGVDRVDCHDPACWSVLGRR